MGQKIIVIGAGIIGASVAWHLAKEGHEVVVLDAGTSSATASSFGWVNASFYQTKDHFQLRMAGMQAWASVLDELGIESGSRGCLCWDGDENELNTQYETLRELGYAVELCNQTRFQHLEPNIANPPQTSLRFPDELVVNPLQVTQAMLMNSRATVLRGMPVTNIEHDSSGVTVQTGFGRFTCDQIVVAAGNNTERLVAPFGAKIPMRESPALVLKTRPFEPICQHVLASPVGDIRQRTDGSFIMPTDIQHQKATAAKENLDAQTSAEQALERLQNLFPRSDLRLAGIDLAYRPIPEDGLPVAGPVADQVYATVMHSGITLAAIVGQLVAKEITFGSTNASQVLLGKFRPERFTVE